MFCSTFYNYELPKFISPRITHVDVILVFDLPKYGLKDQKETCTQGSVLSLKKAVLAKNIKFSCNEIPQ